MAAEREAAKIILSAGDVAVRAKSSSRDVVTEFDVSVQKLLEARLVEAAGPSAFFCEEMNEQGSLSANRVFVIDPIDGTMNFVHGFSCSCISVACLEDGAPVCAAVYNPYLDEMFHAVKNCGAFLNGEKIEASSAPLSKSIVCFGTSPYYDDLRPSTFRLAEAVMGSSLDLRRGGSAALDLCSVAAGRAGLFFELKLSLWDYAAGAFIISEAGGTVLDIDSGALCYDKAKSSVVAGGAQAVKDFFFLTNLQKTLTSE